METPPLQVGNVLFADGNAAARTFGRAHRHRPYHFSCGSVFQGCRKSLRRRTNMRNDCRKRDLMEVGRGGACVPARVALQGRIHRLQVCIMCNAQTFLRMEKPPLRMGDVPFTDGNAAARTFGRAHRRRPYHFSCGSVFQGCRRTVRRRTKSRKGCWRIVRRRTKSKKGCWRTVRRRTKSRKGCWRTVRRRTKTRNVCWRIVRRWTNTRNVCRRIVCRWTKSKMIAGE